MKVYILSVDEHDAWTDYTRQIIGVFDSKDKLELAIKEHDEKINKEYRHYATYIKDTREVK